MTSLIGKTIMITGGTGSFGTTVVQRLLDENEVARIVVFSRDEKKQHEMRLQFHHSKLSFGIGDVRDDNRIMRAMKGVDMVFHAAALKHVPSCEFFPMEAVKTNVIGTHNVIEAALNNGVEKIVVLSTDKAAYPVNAMGCSTMMMEKVVVARAQMQTANDKTVLCSVRYGNVLFSRGSVLPLFFEQMRKGKPLTVTHPGMTRFLMPLSEAIDLVLHALRKGQNGDLFVQKAKAATVGDLARACLALAKVQSQIDIIGIRAGEKMDETLATAEELARAEDQGRYWCIPCEPGRNVDRFFEDGRPNISEIGPFTSKNAEQLSVDMICRMLQGLPEFKTFLPNE